MLLKDRGNEGARESERLEEKDGGGEKNVEEVARLVGEKREDNGRDKGRRGARWVYRTLSAV